MLLKVKQRKEPYFNSQWLWTIMKFADTGKTNRNCISNVDQDNERPKHLKIAEQIKFHKENQHAYESKSVACI